MENIFIKNEERLKDLISRMKEDGKEKLFFIADWNRTFTKAYSEGVLLGSSFSQIRNGNYLDPKYNEEANALFQIYHPIEIDSNISKDEKNTKLIEWWRKHLELMARYGISKQVFEDIAKSKNSLLRDNAIELLDLLHKNQIPLIIISGGVGDLIVSLLEKENKLTENIHIVSSLFEFDKSGKTTKVKETIIHPFNKDCVKFEELSFADEIMLRKNVVLLGDGEEDADMANGFNAENIIKVGFLNTEAETRINFFKKNFDVVIQDDGSMKYICDLLKTIVN